MHRLNPHLATFLALSGFALLGALLILQATPEGLGLSDDSIAYVAGARSLLAGEGYREAWLATNGPVTHFPPMFSGTLALVGLLGVDPLNVARYINALLFGVNAALLGLMGWRATQRAVETASTIAKSAFADSSLADEGRLRNGWRDFSRPAVFLSALFMTNESLFRVHAVAMSEPLFIFFSLLAFLCFDYGVRELAPAQSSQDNKIGQQAVQLQNSELAPAPAASHRTPYWLALTGLLTSLAYLTRYSGLALLATFIVAIFFINKTWRARFLSAIIFLAGYIPLVLAWSIRNEIVAGNATNRSLVWHPVTAEKLQQGLRTFAEFLVPVEGWRSALLKTPEVFMVAIVLIAIILLTWLGMHALKLISPLPAGEGLGVRAKSLPFTNTLYIFGYLGAILFSISLFDASTPLKARILAPIYVSLLFLLVSAGAWAWTNRLLAGRARAIFSALMIFIFSVSATGAARTVTELSRGGTGYASFQWYDSKVMDMLRQLPADVAIYTNEPGAVYLYTGRGVWSLPTRLDPVTGIPWNVFDQGAAIVQRDVRSGRAVLAIFNFDTPDLAADYAAMSNGLYIAEKSSGDVLFTVAP